MLTLGLVTIAFSLVGMAVYQVTGELLVRQRTAEEFARAETLAVSMSAPLKEYDADALYALAARSETAAGARVLVLSTTGVVLVDGGSELNGLRLSQQPEVQSVIYGKERASGFYQITAGGGTPSGPFSWLQGPDGGTEWVGYYVTPILIGEARAGMVLLSSSIQDVADRLATIGTYVLLYFIVGAVAVALMGVWMSGLITRPINELTQVMLKTTGGDFSARAPTRGRDEVAQLGKTFNMMSEKLENLDRARSDFISSASHELKTPLSGMKILVESLYHSDNMDVAMRKEFLQDIDKEIDRLTAIVGDLLTLVQIDSYGLTLTPSTFRLSDVVEETVGRMRPIARKRSISLAVGLEGDPELILDRGKLSQILYNLVDNAVKYTPDGGRVSLRARVHSKNFEVLVSDTGVGIPEDSLPHIFDRFYRVDKARSRSTGGTGLGLSIVRNLVSLLGGAIEVESQVGQGTTFTVTLPCQMGDIQHVI